MKKMDNTFLDQSTEEKIKQSAEKVFMEKGFFGARTRDIAKDAGINLALVNYYFRSKENLFKIIMEEKLGVFFGFVIEILENPEKTLPEKIKILVNKYTDMLISLPDLPMFILNEIKQNPKFFEERLRVKEPVNNGFATLLQANNFSSKEELMQVVLTLLGMTLFPFIAKDVVTNLLNFSPEDYYKMLNKRRELIPVWMEEILKIQQK
ncbi:Transcriptional regulator, TetR family [uncultured Paludibacter sp.]|uniref:Transcriptional regulator, TetR family n=1 Tax=uncultured Paludibacter sp. TaxID=497635 RepID=A0A653AJV4_9BACT|nr:Transcriptional regulator, TetR family [uncultured Paludibacter sp.]